MNINPIKGLLGDLAGNNVNRVASPPKTGSFDNLRDASTFGRRVLDGLNAGKLEKHAQMQNARTGAQKASAEPPTTQLNFVPLPMRSDLFPEARFFARLDERDGENRTGGAEKTEIFVYVETDSLGSIWVSMSWINHSLSIRYYTENNDSSKTIREDFAVIKKDLIELGFKEVSQTSQAREDLGSLTSVLLPQFDAYLINQRV